MAVVVKPVWDILVGLGEFTTHLSRDFSGDWDVHWGYDLDFHPMAICGCVSHTECPAFFWGT